MCSLRKALMHTDDRRQGAVFTLDFVFEGR